MARMTLEDKLGTNRYQTDELNSHIDVDKECPDRREIDRVVRACPAGLYKVGENGALSFDHLGCLECGTCRVLSLGQVVRKWNYPAGSLGVEYRFG